MIKIDGQIRRKHAKIHSSGHILDLAVRNLCNIFLPLEYGWTGTKGYHFIDGPYVENKGTI